MNEHVEQELYFGYATPVVDTDLDYLSESDVETLTALLKDAGINTEDYYE